MSFHDLLQMLRAALAPDWGKHRRQGSRLAATHRPNLESLDERALPSLVAHYSFLVNHYADAVVTGDFNLDGKLDVAVANGQVDGIAYGFDNTVSVLLGNGDGTFQQPPLTSPTGYSPRSIAVGDFNRDGKLDVATANGDLSVLLGNGDGTFQTPTDIPINSSASSVAVGDFNGDGRMDIGVASDVFFIDGMDDYGFMWGHDEAMANVLLGNGDGSFAVPSVTDLGSSYVDYVYSGTTFLSAATTVRINGDTCDDFVTINAFGSLAVLLGDRSGVLQFAGSLDTGGALSSVAGGDVNGDGKLDVATANSSSNTASVLYGNGDGTFSSPLNSFAEGNRIAAGDFNGDGWLDAAISWVGYVNNNYTGCVFPLINDHSWPAPNAPSIRISDVAVTEGNTGSKSDTFTLSLSAASNQTVTVAYATANGSATAGSDYTSASGTLTFAPGETSKTITVLAKGDRLAEPNETFFVNLGNSTNATIADAQGIGTVVDDEPRISISDVTQGEGKKGKSSKFIFTVTLSAAYDQTVTMSFQTVDGTARTANADYTAKTGTITFKPGETSKTISIEVIGDSRREADEYFYLDLYGNSSNSLFTKNRGIGTILNDD